MSSLPSGAVTRGLAYERLAFDLKSARHYDADNRLHVSISNLSRATVNPYRTEEIPGASDLGLKPGATYSLLRDPKELAGAVATFNRLPVQLAHKAMSAEDHDADIVVGSTGSDAQFDAPFLQSSLVIWDKRGIDAVESGAQKELSCAYRYVPDMTPGVYEGQKYDGVMRSISGSHVALVPKGRAGPDCVVGDSALPPAKKETTTMALTAPKSRRALMATCAVRAYLRPKLAADAAIDVGAIVKGVTAKNWKTSKPKIATALAKATQGKLAQDATLADFAEMLDQLDEMVDEMPDEPTAADPADTTEDSDAEMMDRLKDVLKAKGMSDEDVAAVLAAMKPEVDPPSPNAADKVAKDKEPPVVAKKDEKDDKVSKPAMDAALARTRAETEAAVVARMNAIRAAENDVRPIIGEVAMAQDSAADVYRLALDHAGIAHDGVDPSAFPALIALHKRTLEVAAAPKPRVAMDAAAAKGFAERFPNAGRLVK